MRSRLVVALSWAALILQACGGTGSAPASQSAGASAASGSGDPNLAAFENLPDFSGRTITLQSWGGAAAAALDAAFYGPFAEATGAKINLVEVTGETPARLRTMVDAGNIEWDMINAWGNPDILSMAEEGLLAKVDHSAIPGGPALAVGATNEYGLATHMSVMVPGWIQKDGIRPLTSVNDFFNVAEFPGRRAVSNWGDDERNVAAALLADGVAREDLYPLDVERALKVWDPVKSSVDLWYNSGSELASALIDERVDYCLCWDGRAKQAMAQNPKWTFTFEGAYLGYENTAMVTGSKNQDIVQALMQVITDPARQAVFVQGFDVSASNPKYVDYLPASYHTPERAKYSPTSPENIDKWWTPSASELEIIAGTKRALEERWTEWVSQ